MARINHNGYVEIYLPKHHRARGNGYVFEHIVVLEKHLGRDILRGEDVHHKDENKQNNDPFNLEVMSTAEHTRKHMKSKPRKGLYLSCPVCETVFYVKPSHVKAINHCSRSCKAKSQIRKKGRF